MNKVAKECQCASYNQSYGKPVNFGFHALACRSIGESSFFVLERKNESNTAFGFGRLTGGDYKSAFQCCSSVISSLDSSRAYSSWGWSCPCGNLLAAGNHGERVFSDEVFSLEPADNSNSEWVMDFNVVVGEDNLWTNYENPEQGRGRSGVHKADQGFQGLVYSQVGNDNNQSDGKNSYEVNPIASCSVKIVAHDPNSTAPKNSFYSDLLVEKGK